MQVLAFSKLHLFSKGISGRHVAGLIPLALPVGAEALPDPQRALCGVLWAGGVAGVAGMVASWGQLGVRRRISTGAGQRLEEGDLLGWGTLVGAFVVESWDGVAML